MSLFNAFCVPMSLSFEPKTFETTLFTSMNYIIDTCFMIDIGLSFITVFVDDFGNEEKRHYYIAINYIKTGLCMDLLATIPFDIFIDDK